MDLEIGSLGRCTYDLGFSEEIIGKGNFGNERFWNGFYKCGKDAKGKGVNIESFHKCNGIIGFFLNLNTKLQPQFTRLQHINL